MKLTHHKGPSRSFILITFIVLSTVYAALVLTRIQRLYVEEPTMETAESTLSPMTSEAALNIPELTTIGWAEYTDDTVPLNILVPPNWRTGSTDELEDYHIITLARSAPQSLIRIFVSKHDFAGVSNLRGRAFTTKQGYAATSYDKNIYTIKAGEYYYTFDGINAQSNLDELSTIVQTARLD